MKRSEVRLTPLPRREHNGVSYADTGPTGPSSRDATFVLLHGLGSSADFWHRTVGELAQHARIITVDIPGISRGRPPVPFTLDGVVGTIIDLLAALPVERVVVVGHSLGGVIAMRTAATCAAVVDRLVLVNGTLGTAAHLLKHPLSARRYPRVAANIAAQFLGGAFPVQPWAARTIASSRLLRGATLRPYVAHPERLDPDALATALASTGGSGGLSTVFAAQHVDHATLMRQVPCPVEIVWGDRDALIHPDDLAEARANGEVTRELAIPDCGHWPMLEKSHDLAEFVLGGGAVDPEGTVGEPGSSRA